MRKIFYVVAGLLIVSGRMSITAQQAVGGTGDEFHKIAEGVYTSEALMALSQKYGVDLPISETVYEIVVRGADPREQLTRLFLRATKGEKD